MMNKIKSSEPKVSEAFLKNPVLDEAVSKIDQKHTNNHILRVAQLALWNCEGIITMSEILKMTGFLQSKKEEL